MNSGDSVVVIEIINICLDHFIEYGLYETSTRSLSKALKLQRGGMYNHFSSKDEAVLACAEEAAFRLEKSLIVPALKEISNPELMMRRLRNRADQMAPTMRFLVSVCSSDRYKLELKPALGRLSERYNKYAEKFANKLGCDVERVAPYLYMTITAVTNYMIFAEDSYIYPQIQVIKQAINGLKNTQFA